MFKTTHSPNRQTRLQTEHLGTYEWWELQRLINLLNDNLKADSWEIDAQNDHLNFFPFNLLSKIRLPNLNHPLLPREDLTHDQYQFVLICSDTVQALIKTLEIRKPHLDEKQIREIQETTTEMLDGFHIQYELLTKIN